MMKIAYGYLLNRWENRCFKLAMTVAFYACIFNVSAQNEFEVLFNIEKGFSSSSTEQIIQQWSAHAKNVCQNPNCLNTLEAELKTLIDQNITGLNLGFPYEAQVNYSNCKIEKFSIDTFSRQPVNQAFITYHISSCIDPSYALVINVDKVRSADDVPLLVTYMEQGKWNAFDHYGYTNTPFELEFEAKRDLMYEDHSLKLLCEENGYRIYEIKNAAKHEAVIDVKSALTSKGIDMRKCMNNDFVQGPFNGRFQMLIEYYHELEIRYILTKTEAGKRNIVIRFTNRHPTLMAEIKVIKGVKTEGGSSNSNTYSVSPNGITTVKLDDFVEFEYGFKMPKDDVGITNKVINYLKEYIRKQITIDNDKINIGKANVFGVRG